LRFFEPRPFFAGAEAQQADRANVLIGFLS